MPGTLKRCKQCGEIKPAIENFRKYYHENAKSSYKVCKSCEKINQRYKYLTKKPNPSSSDETEIQLIQELYKVQREQGLKPPGAAETESIDIVAALAKQQAQGQRQPVIVDNNNQRVESIPHDLQHWLSVDLQAFKPEDLEQVSDELLAKYKKPTGVDPVSLAPIYDDKYRDIINEILKRFDDYEDHYYEEQE
ncbi:hypothetical protein D3C71_234660 [compost metagenome]